MTTRIVCDACGDDIGIDERRVMMDGRDFHDQPECIVALNEAFGAALEATRGSAKGKRDERLRDKARADAGLTGGPVGG